MRGLRRSGFVLLLGGAAALGGCTSVIKQAYYEVRGAQADIVVLDKGDASVLQRAQAVKFEPATVLIGPKVTPPELLRAYDVAIEGLADDLRKDAYPGGDPLLTVRSEMLYSQTKGLLSGALSLIRVRMAGSDGGTMELLLKSESKSFRAGGEADLADAAAKALGEFLRKGRGQTEPTAETD